VDTPGAFSGRKAEEQGQAWAISEDLMALARSPVPVVSLVIGEGGSGGALAMCLADYVGMLENSYLSVIAPEACASIIFRDSSRAEEAADSMRITARDLKQQGIVDEVLPEPLGGAHQEPEETVEAVGEALERVLAGISGAGSDELVDARYERYRNIGAHLARQP
jgi:acetyl-CoA carboxylase carboxyl transferase subunit alpha